jgi:hypothetical protein
MGGPIEAGNDWATAFSQYGIAMFLALEPFPAASGGAARLRSLLAGSDCRYGRHGG